jgi:glutamate/aspartate transport system substrate-binding protein
MTRVRTWTAVRLAALPALLAAAALLAVVPVARAQGDGPVPQVITGVLKRVKDARVVRLGVREAAVPFASISAGGQASGYSVDLCLSIVDDLAQAVGLPSLRVEFRPVTPADRIDQVVDGRIDLECGATTNTAERRARVAFSPPIFIAGTQLMVRRGSPVRSLRDLAGASVAVVRGTTNEAAMRRWAADPARRLRLDAVDDYDSAVARVASGESAALAADDVLLAGYIAERGLRRRYAVVGELLSYEPYGIVFAKDDPALAEIVHATFARLATSGDIRSIYNKWFVRPLPSGVQLRWPMSLVLERSFEILGLPPE